MRRRRTIIILIIAILLSLPSALPHRRLITIEHSQKAEGSVLRLRRFEVLPNSASGHQDILAIGGNALARIEGTSGKTIWRSEVGDQAEINFIIGKTQTSGRVDILALYGNPLSAERVNESDGNSIETYLELLNTSVWDLDTKFVDLDGVYPEELVIGTSSNLVLMESDFSEELWNVSLDKPRNRGIYPFLSANGLPLVGTWIEEIENSTFLMFDARNGDSLWNLSLPKEGAWLLYGGVSSMAESCKYLLFFATQNASSTINNLLLVHCDNGTTLWSTNLGSMWFRAVRGNFSGSGELEFLLVGEKEDGTSVIVALNGLNNQTIWQESDMPVAKLSVADFTNDSVSDLAFVQERSVVVLDGVTREPLWEPKRFGASIQALCTKAANDDESPKVIVGLADGKVHALNATTGDTIWTNSELAENPIIEIAKSPIGAFEVIFAFILVSSFILFRTRQRKVSQSSYSR
ncbi:MAG: PQQ-binding-like beta-propeller repeat protein [Candidatus Hodarchaeota archaeon]